MRHKGLWRLLEFFEDGDGRFSMGRLLCFLAFFPAAHVAYQFGKEVFGIFCTCYGPGTFGISKGYDTLENIFKPKQGDSNGTK